MSRVGSATIFNFMPNDFAASSDGGWRLRDEEGAEQGRGGGAEDGRPKRMKRQPK